METQSATQNETLFTSILDKNERVLWSDRPVFVPFILKSMMLSLYLLAFGTVWLLVTWGTKEAADSSGVDFFWLFGLLPLAQGVYSLFKAVSAYPRTAYAFTDRRIIIRTGVFGIEYKTIDYDK